MHAVLRYTNGDRRIFQIPDDLLGARGSCPHVIELDGVSFALVLASSPGLPVYAETLTSGPPTLPSR